MKPRSKRNRKRPRSEVQNYDHVQIETTVAPLSVHGVSCIPNAPLLRTVHPYPYTFCSFAKARWVGRTLLDVYCTEFGSYPESYYRQAIASGRILVNDERVDNAVNYKIFAGDVLSHTVHRHEPAVVVYSSKSRNDDDDVTTTSSRRPRMIRVVGETDTLLAVDKTSSLPVHPCGGYHQNSLMKMLETEYGDDNKLYTIHRLDRLTSGLVVLAKTSAAAQEWGRAIQERSCQKLYLARVKGRFGFNLGNGVPRLHTASSNNNLPVCGEWLERIGDGDQDKTICSSENAESSAAAARRRNAHGYWMTNCKGDVCSDMSLEDYTKSEHSIDEWLDALNDPSSASATDMIWFNFACPVRIEQPKIGVCASGLFTDLDSETYSKTVKPAQTSFASIHYNPKDDSTLLLVRPETGRTHQIRIHLQYLGHSIANDPNYGGSLWFGNPQGQRACNEAQRILDSENDSNDDGVDKPASQSLVTTDTAATEREVAITMGVRGEEESLESFIQRTCVWCARNRGKTVEERSALEFLVRSPGLWLHAFQYTFESTSFRTEVPEWCQF